MAVRLIVVGLFLGTCSAQTNDIECPKLCSGYGNGVDPNADPPQYVCMGTDGVCMADGQCSSGGPGSCRIKPGDECEHYCMAWTGGATHETRNVCMKQARQGSQFVNHFTCSDIGSQGCQADQDEIECRQKPVPYCITECSNKRSIPDSNGKAYYASPTDPALNTALTITPETEVVCMQNYPTAAYSGWSGVCLDMPCDHDVHGLGWNGSQPCKQIFDLCPNKCDDGPGAPCAPNCEDSSDQTNRKIHIGGKDRHLVCYDSWKQPPEMSVCKNPVTFGTNTHDKDGVCPQGFRKKCAKRDTLLTQAPAYSNGGWGLSEIDDQGGSRGTKAIMRHETHQK